VHGPIDLNQIFGIAINQPGALLHPGQLRSRRFIRNDAQHAPFALDLDGLTGGEDRVKNPAS